MAMGLLFYKRFAAKVRTLEAMRTQVVFEAAHTFKKNSPGAKKRLTSLLNYEQYARRRIVDASPL